MLFANINVITKEHKNTISSIITHGNHHVKFLKFMDKDAYVVLYLTNQKKKKFTVTTLITFKGWK